MLKEDVATGTKLIVGICLQTKNDKNHQKQISNFFFTTNSYSIIYKGKHGINHNSELINGFERIKSPRNY